MLAGARLEPAGSSTTLPPFFLHPSNCLGSALVVQKPRVRPQRDARSPPELGAEGTHTGVQASELGQGMGILSVVLKVKVPGNCL